MDLLQIDRIAYLFSHYFTDTLSAEESAELDHWLDADQQNRLLLDKINRLNFYTEKQIEAHLYNSCSAFQKVQARHRQNILKKRMRKVYTGVAAVVLVAFGITLINIDRTNNQKIPDIPVAQLSAGESRAILTLANGQRLELGRQMKDSVIAESGIKLDASGASVEYPQGLMANEVSSYNILEVPRKGEFRLVLADGTKVWLNSDSRLKYPVSFTGQERRVYLEGEAYFEVSKNKDFPFVVDMDKASIQVLGTAFNARAYKEETQICATLAEGKILLNAGNRKLILDPEEQGRFDRENGSLIREKVDIKLYTGWKDGRFIFQEQTLEEMMNTLSRWYDIRVTFETEAVKKITFSGNLKRYESFNKIIELLEMTKMAHFKVHENAVLISE